MGRDATAALELVLVLPVLIVIAIGGTDLGRAVQYGNVLSNAARVGAAYGATHCFTDYTYSNWESRVTARVTEEAGNLPDFDPAQLQVVIDPILQADDSYRIEVEVTYPFETIFHWPGWPSQVPIRRQVAMQGYR